MSVVVNHKSYSQYCTMDDPQYNNLGRSVKVRVRINGWGCNVLERACGGKEGRSDWQV